MSNALFDMRPAAEIHPPQPGAQPPADAPAPLRSVHTSNFPELLRRLGVSLMVTTYQAGKLVIVREQAGCLNTHFRAFQSPMGMALTPNGAAGPRHGHPDLGVPRRAGRRGPTRTAAAARRLLPSPLVARDWQHPHSRDGLGPGRGHRRIQCRRVVVHQHPFLLPRHVGPRFQLRAALAATVCKGARVERSLPLERPGDGRSPAALRHRAGRIRRARRLARNKARGGVLIDVQSSEIVARELLMPHSPRWHDGRLWLCESGAGTLGVVELQTGRYEPVVDTPGFTRGLDFAGRYAFVGLSQVRESAVFSGIPITERLVDPAQRMCGVCVVDLRSGEVVAWLQFMDGVQEVFAVQVVPRRYPDLINDDVALMQNSFVVPDAALSEISHAMHVPSGSPGPAPQQAGTSVHS